MRNEILIDHLPRKMVNNKVLVGLKDTFEGFTSNGGIKLVNLTEEDSWGDSIEFNISEFVMRHGKVILTPEVITKGSFGYETENELVPGDTVFWNLISFQSHIPFVYKKSLYLMVDYHEILARKRNGELTPINGYALFTPVGETLQALSYVIQKKITDEWELCRLPDKNVEYENKNRTVADCWEVGDHVRLLVQASPYKLEGNIQKTLDKEYFACPVNFIICTI